MYTHRVRVWRPSLFAIVSLLVLLALAQVANLAIAHFDIGRSLLTTRLDGSFATHAPSESDPVVWPTVPDEVLEELGAPSRWSRTIYNTHSWTFVEWLDEESTTRYRSRLIETHHGSPLPVYAKKYVMADRSGTYAMIWPIDGGLEDDAATTYHPLGLIVNPIVFALPIWAAMLLLRQLLLLERRRRRRARGQCTRCAYDLRGLTILTTCPECGTAV